MAQLQNNSEDVADTDGDCPDFFSDDEEQLGFTLGRDDISEQSSEDEGVTCSRLNQHNLSVDESFVSSESVIVRNTKKIPFSNPFSFPVVVPPKSGMVVLCPSELCAKRGHHVVPAERMTLLNPTSAIQIVIRAEFRVTPEADWVCRPCYNRALHPKLGRALI